MAFFRAFGSKGTNNVASQQISVDPTFTPSPILLQKIKAFQTITTFLAQINRRTPFKPYDNILKDQHPSQENLNEVELCDAFAHLAVVWRDVVAVSTNRHKAELEILASSSTSEDNELFGPDDTTKPPKTFVQKYLTFCLTKNTRFDEDKSTPVTTHPSISDAVGSFGDLTLDQYLIDLEKNW
jgi:hypothetical protein